MPLPETITFDGIRGGTMYPNGPIGVYTLKAGTIVHVEGCPVRIDADVEVTTATDLAEWCGKKPSADGFCGKPI